MPSRPLRNWRPEARLRQSAIGIEVGRADLVFLQARQLQRDVPQKRGIVQIAAPEPSWILQEPVQPLEADALDPWCAIANAPGMKIECRPDPEQHTMMQMRNADGA